MIIAVIDGMGGGIGVQIVTQLRQELPLEVEILALGANAIATDKMMRAKASRGASGENAIQVSVDLADFIIAPIGVVIPNSMMGEITPAIAEAVAGARGYKFLLPINQPHFEIVGIEWKALTKQIRAAIAMVREQAGLPALGAHREGKEIGGDLELARTVLQAQGKALVLVKDRRVLGTGERKGMADLLALAEQLDEEAQGAALADRVVGKAVAMVAWSMGVASIYALLVSEPAKETLVRGGVSLEYEQLVPTILNEKGDGPCPLERLVAAIEDPEEAVRMLQSFLR